MAARRKKLCKAPEVERAHMALRTGGQWEGGSPGVKEDGPCRTGLLRRKTWGSHCLNQMNERRQELVVRDSG